VIGIRKTADEPTIDLLDSTNAQELDDCPIVCVENLDMPSEADGTPHLELAGDNGSLARPIVPN
jgi:hypothetical protein